jgi:hypothetical protein
VEYSSFDPEDKRLAETVDEVLSRCHAADGLLELEARICEVCGTVAVGLGGRDTGPLCCFCFLSHSWARFLCDASMTASLPLEALPAILKTDVVERKPTSSRLLEHEVPLRKTLPR